MTQLKKQNCLFLSGLLIALTIAITACSAADQLAGVATMNQLSPISPLVISATPDVNNGAMIGRIVSTADSSPRPLGGTTVRLAEIVLWEEDKSNGTFVLEGATSPGAITTEDGAFEILNLKPGDYVIVVGDIIGFNEIISEQEGIAKVYTVVAGEVLNVGMIEVELR